jgi:hypothetical protein
MILRWFQLPLLLLLSLYQFCFYIPHALYFYCKVFIFQKLIGFFLITFLSSEIATSINIHVYFLLSRIIIIIIVIIIITIIIFDDAEELTT